MLQSKATGNAARLLLASLLIATGCGRTPPSPTRQTASASDPAAAASPPAVAGNSPRIVRDDRVAPAAFVVPVKPPPSEQLLAAEALARIGPPAVPRLVEALRSPDGQVRRQACAVLLRMGPDAKEAVPDLVRLLEDDDEDLRKMAAKALGRIGPDAAPAVPALMRTLLEEAPPPESVESASFSR